MKLPAADIYTETQGVIKEKAFGIGNVGLIFEILRSKMYRDPISAIVREISCNARDAHREVGKADLPIEITLPNNFQPKLKIKDFGPGISPDRMENIFIQYANSTKRNDNLQTGGFGLGSKSPFAYTDTFVIVTVVDGIKRSYNAYIDESREGRMALFSEEQTQDPNGTIIEIPVKRQDIRAFEKSVLSLTQFFNPLPILKGVTPAPVYPEHVELLKGTNWFLDTKGDEKATAIIDGIEYSFVEMPLKENIEVLNLPIRFIFGIGELSLSASRDTIHFDEPSLTLIKKRTVQCATEIKELLTQKVEQFPTYTDAALYFAEFTKTLQRNYYSGRLGNDILSGVKWKGQTVKTMISAVDFGKWAKINQYQRFAPAFARKSKSQKRFFTVEKPLYLNDPEFKFFINDQELQSFPGVLIEYIFNSNPNCNNIYILSTFNEPKAASYLTEVENAAKNGKPGPKIEYNTTLISYLNPIKLSTIEVPKNLIQRKSRISAADTEICAYSLHRSTYSHLEKTIVVKKQNEDGVYIESTDSSGLYLAGDLNPIRSYDVIASCSKILGQEIFAFTSTRAKKLGSKWLKLDAAANKYIKDKLGTRTVDDFMADYYSILSWDSEPRILEKLKNCTFTGLIGDYFTETKRLDKLRTDLADVYYLISLFKDFDSKKKYTSLRNTLISSIEEKYPLLNKIDCYDFNKKILNDVELYIKMKG